MESARRAGASASPRQRGCECRTTRRSTSLSSDQGWAARHSPPGLRRAGRKNPHPRARRAAARQRGGARRAGDLSARSFPAAGVLARRRGTIVQSRELLLRRRQHEALRRGADPLSRARFRARSAYREGTTTGWPFAYDELEPWYTRAEKLYRVHGALRTSTAPSRPIPSPIRSAPFRTSRRSRRCESE